MTHSWLDQPLTSYAYGWRLDRDDGVSIGFTSHDRDIVIDNFQYRASPGLVPSSVALTDDLDLDSVEIEGVLSASAIAENDLAAGRWNGALLHLSLLNWEQPLDQPLYLISGEFGEITRIGDAFSVEIQGPTSFLNEAIVPSTSPTCRAHFGDRRCKIGLQNFQREVDLTSGGDSQLEFSALENSAANFAFGELRWLSGENNGLSSAILKGAGNSIWLADHPFNSANIGDRALLTAGCDKNFSTCSNRFSNSFNFRGEPHLPGNDFLTRYPGA